MFQCLLECVGGECFNVTQWSPARQTLATSYRHPTRYDTQQPNLVIKLEKRKFVHAPDLSKKFHNANADA